MAKLTLNDISNISGAESTAIATINNNSAAIETALENTLSRNGASPNTMNSDIDLNGNDLLNVGTVDTDNLTIAGVDYTDSLQGSVAEAEAAATAAALSETNAATSADEAAASAAEAATFDPSLFITKANNGSDFISPPKAQANLVVPLATLKASSASFADGDVIRVSGRAVSGDGGAGRFRYSTDDLSSTFIRQTVSVASGEIDPATNNINKTAHGLRTGQGVLVTGGDGLTANTTVYYVRGRLPNDLSLHPTYVDAVLNTNRVDITGTTAFDLRVLADPDQVVYATFAGKALDGSEGGLIRTFTKKRRVWCVEWFPSSGPDDTDQINRTILAAGVDATVFFPADTLVISQRDNDDVCLWRLSGQTWRGVNRQVSIVQLSSLMVSQRFVVRDIDGAENCVMQDMCFDGNRDNITPISDLYSSFNLLVGPDGGGHNRYKRLLLKNCWGRSLQTGYESGDLYTEDVLVDDVRVLNSGSKAISLTENIRGVVKNCYVEVNAYTAAENPAGVDANSASCYESNQSFDAIFVRNRGKQLSSVRGPGIRLINGSTDIKAIRNYIEGASYLAFIQVVEDVEFAHNTGVNIQGNAILIADSAADEPDYNTIRIHVYRNKIVDPTGAYVLITASKDGMDAFVEAYIYDNDFIKTASGTPTHGIYNNGVIAPATGGSCIVHQWDNRFIGGIPNQLAGPAAIEIQPEPNRGWHILGQSSISASHTGSTTQTTLATVTVPAYALGKNGRLRVTAHWSWTPNANNKFLRIRFGGLQASAVTVNSNSQNRMQIELGNQGVANSQIVSVPGIAAGFGQSATAVYEMAVDTASDTTVQFSGELAVTTDEITLESYIVEVFYEL